MNIEIHSKINKWRHPIQWFKEMKTRNLLEKFINYRLERKEYALSDIYFHIMATGHNSTLNMQDNEFKCSVCGEKFNQR
jgi:hypothetical protein